VNVIWTATFAFGSIAKEEAASLTGLSSLCAVTSKKQEESLKDLARFFKEYMPRYGYKYLCTEGDDCKYYQTLGLKCIQNDGCLNYALVLEDLGVWVGIEKGEGSFSLLFLEAD